MKEVEEGAFGLLINFFINQHGIAYPFNRQPPPANAKPPNNSMLGIFAIF